jgi:hypothetical protein
MKNKTKPDFKFDHKKNYDISEIKKFVIKFNDQWFINTSRQEIFDVHKHTNSYILNQVSLGWIENTPLDVIKKEDDKEAWDLIGSIVKDLEDMCNGTMGQVLFIKLAAGKDIDPHEDSGDYLYHTNRHHIPIITNPNVGFFIDGETQHMKEGECWEINNNKTHAVFNKGTEDRVHLLIDIIPNEVIRGVK